MLSLKKIYVANISDLSTNELPSSLIQDIDNRKKFLKEQLIHYIQLADYAFRLKNILFHLF